MTTANMTFPHFPFGSPVGTAEAPSIRHDARAPTTGVREVVLWERGGTAAARSIWDVDIPDVQLTLRWVQQNEDTLRSQFGGMWIAVAGDRVITSGPTLGEVSAFLSANGIRGALVEFMDADALASRNLIA